MPGLKLNGVEIPVRADNMSVSRIYIQDKARAFDGTPRKTVRATKREWSLEITPQTQSTMDAYRQLINGEGHYWDFSASNTSYSSKGLNLAASSLTNFAATSFAKYGSTSMLVDGGYAETIGNHFGSVWTLLVWKLNGAETAWDHFIITPNGSGRTNYKNGVANTDNATMDPWCSLKNLYSATGLLSFISPDYFATTWAASTAYATAALAKPTSGSNPYRFYASTGGTTSGTEPTWPSTEGATVTDGSVVWKNIGRKALFVDDAVMLPYATPDSWGPDLYTEHAARAWSSLPLARASGDLVNNGPINVLGEAGESRIVPHSINGTWTTNAETMAFVLDES